MKANDPTDKVRELQRKLFTAAKRSQSRRFHALCSVSYEVLPYRPWVETGRLWEPDVARRAGRLVDRYADTTAHP